MCSSMLEERAGRRLFKGPFGTQPRHGVLPFCNLVSRNAASGMPFLGRGRLYAPYEVSLLLSHEQTQGPRSGVASF